MLLEARLGVEVYACNNASVSCLLSRDSAISRCRIGKTSPNQVRMLSASSTPYEKASRNAELRASIYEKLATYYTVPSPEVETPKEDWQPPKTTYTKERPKGVSTAWRRKAKRVPEPRGNLFLDTGQTDHQIDLEAILESLKGTITEEEMYKVMAEWKGKLSMRLMMSLLNSERDWQRALALHDWMLEEGGYKPSIFGYNIVIRNVLKARQWTLGEGLVSEMIDKGVAPDKFTYACLISAFGKAGKFDSAILWLQRMEEKGVRPDLVTYSTLIELAGKVKNFSKAVSLFTKMREAGTCDDSRFFLETNFAISK